MADPDRILRSLEHLDLVRFPEGSDVLEAGGNAASLLVLVEGEVEAVRDGMRIDLVSERGAVFGEISALLGVGHSATVRTTRPSAFYVIDEPTAYLKENPVFHLHVSVLLARRLNNLVKYLADVKRQYEGHDHLGMVDTVLDSLIHRQPRKREGGG